ncbi:MAG: DUF3087 family protein [Thiotrichales bacterium]|nr:DUF3087 family protein [Thiotrichales bacterium]
MFEIQDVDPKLYRQKTRNATLIIMGMFLVIGMIFATLSVKLLSAYNSNPWVLNFIGALVGLIITFFIVKVFFVDKAWMRESMYGWRLKRSLMRITNVMEKLRKDVAINDHQAIKTMRFYHLGLEQMHRLEDNHSELIDLLAEKRELEDKMNAAGIDLNQSTFDPSQVARYHSQSN